MMQPPNTVEPALEQEIAAIAESQGCELYHLELKGGLLRIFLDRPQGGVNLQDCEVVSRQVSALLDVVDFSDHSYTLEVSSPGLDRQLYRPRDFERFQGSRVRVTFHPTDGGSQRTIVGRLAAFRQTADGEMDGGEIDVVESDREQQVTTLPLERVKKARLEIEL